LAAALALYALGLLAKETTLALPVLLLATLTALPPALRRRAAAWSAPFWALALAYAAFQFAHFGIAGAVVRGMQPVPEPDEALWLRPALAAKTYAYYLRLLLWPMNLSAQHHFYFPINYHGPHAWPWLVGCAAALAASVGLARMRPDWLALIVWPWACLAPVNNLVPFRGRPIGEQRLYAPSIGFCLLFGALYHALVTQRRVPPVWMRLARCLFAATMLVFLFQAVNRSAVWDEPRRFWMDLARKSPIQTTANAALAEIYLAADLPNVALNHCDLATHYYDSRQFEPENFGALMTQAEAMERLGALDEAVGCYQRILKHQPGNDRAALGIGRALGVQGRHEEALAVFLDVARRRPEHSTAHLNAGLALCNLGRVEEGLAALRRARDFSPADLSVSLDIAKALAQLGREQEARREFEAVYRAARLRLRERPGDPEAARLWAHAALALGLRDEAEAALRTLQQTRPLPGTR
jgi:tetratricopeptide (TPR) repeat protein